MSKGLDKYLQDAKRCCALEVNYFDDTARPTNTSLISETTEQVNKSSKNNLPPAKQESMEEVESAINILESLKIDTGHTALRYYCLNISQLVCKVQKMCYQVFPKND